MNYMKALEDAVLFIEQHLYEEITAIDVAAAAGYSYYHFTRQFSAVLGESIVSYIQKRRLAESAKKLLYTNMRIIDIAVEGCFGSSEAFSRAFKSLYGFSPHVYRQNRLDLMIAAKNRLEPELLLHRVRNMTVHPKIVEIPAIKTAGLRGQTTLRDNVIPQLWARFNTMIHQIPNQIPGGRGFGICEACEENCLWTMNEDVLFNEVASVEVASFDGLPESFVPKTIPGGKYAVFTHMGSLATLTETFNYIWGTWFLSTKEIIDDREDFELYDDRFLGYGHPESAFDIYIPIQ